MIDRDFLQARLDDLTAQADQHSQLALMANGAIQFCEALMAELDAAKVEQDGPGSGDDSGRSASDNAQAGLADVHDNGRGRAKSADRAADSEPS